MGRTRGRSVRSIFAAMCAGVGIFAASVAISGPETPAVCLRDAQGSINFRACADTAAHGSAERALALINLGSEAFRRQDYAEAVRDYDEADPPGGTQHVWSDASFHAYRAVTYDHVGRTAEAIANARTALAMLRGDASIPANIRAEAANVDVETTYALILPLLHKANDSQYASARDAYLALPAKDWIDWANRATVLQLLGDLAAALETNQRALALEPDQPPLLNSECYFLALARRASEALPYCERAIAAVPGVAAVRDSYATALAAAGRCTEADAQRREARRLDPSSVDYQQRLNCITK